MSHYVFTHLSFVDGQNGEEKGKKHQGKHCLSFITHFNIIQATPLKCEQMCLYTHGYVTEVSTACFKIVKNGTRTHVIRLRVLRIITRATCKVARVKFCVGYLSIYLIYRGVTIIYADVMHVIDTFFKTMQRIV